MLTPIVPAHLEHYLMSSPFEAPEIAPTGESPRLATPWRFAIFGAGFIGVQIFVGLVVGVVFAGYLIASGELSSLSDPAQLERLFNNYAVSMAAVTSLPMTASALGLCYVCRRFIDKRPWQTMGFCRPVNRGIAGLATGFLLGVTPILLAAGVVLLAGGFLLSGFDGSVATLAVIPVLVLMAFTEELIFRGYLLQNLIDIRRTTFGIVFSSIAFWLIHGLNPGAWSSPWISLNLFGAGIILAQAYLLSGNIWYPTIMHFGWNAAQGILLSIPVSGLNFRGAIGISIVEGAPSWLTGGDFGLEGSAVVTLIEIGMILLLSLVLRGRNAVSPVKTL